MKNNNNKISAISKVMSGLIASGMSEEEAAKLFADAVEELQEIDELIDRYKEERKEEIEDFLEDLILDKSLLS